MTIGEKIYELRKEKGISQETMALDLNVSRQAVSKWETDQSLPDLDKIKLLSNYFNVSTDYLINDSGVSYEVEEKSVDFNKSNNFKRIIKLMLNTSIGLHIVYLCYFLLVILLQENYSYTNLYKPYVFPYVDLIFAFLMSGIVIAFSYVFKKQLCKSKNTIKFKIIFIIVYFLSSMLLSYLKGVLVNVFIKSLHVSQVTLYFSIMQAINEYVVILEIANILFCSSVLMLIGINLHDSSAYRLPSIQKQYNVSDSILSFLIGLFLGIPGLVFEILWLIDAKCDNRFRFKKMRFWYIIGFIISIVISILYIIFN